MAPTRARALLVALALLAAPALAEVVTGRVVGVSDGDTITVLDGAKTQHKVRLSGIDAPEKGQAFGDRSRETCRASCSTGRWKRTAISATATGAKCAR